MNTVPNLVHASLRPRDRGGYVAVVDEIAIHVEGETLEVTVGRLRDAILRSLRDESVREIALTTGPRLRLILDVELDQASRSSSDEEVSSMRR